MLGEACKYDAGFKCFKWGACPYEGILPCLKVSVLAQARELERLLHRQMQKHSEVSIKWRNETYYLKKKLKKIELFLVKEKIKLPSCKELDSLTKGGKNERLRSNDKKEVARERPAL